MARLRVRRPRLRFPLALVVVLSLVGGLVASPAVTAQNTRSNGYWLAAASGNVYAFGDAPPLGGPDRAGAQFVDLATTNTGRGYWYVTHDGRVVGVGDAASLGSVSERSRRGGAIVAIAARPQADGYWVLQSDGDVHAFGAAPALAPLDRAAAYTDLAATPSGDGFWALDARGVVHARGDARLFGAATRPATAIAIAPTPAGDGYWILSALGQIDARGAAVQRGEPGVGGAYVDLAVTRSGNGYWVADAQGRVYAFGDAPHYGELGRPLLRGAPVVAIAVTPFVNLPPVVTDDTATLDEDTHVVVDVLANDSDPENDTLRVRVRAAPVHGAAVVEADGRIRYTPVANYHGADEIGYEADDGNGGITPGVLRLTVRPVNDAPVAVDDALVVDEDAVLTVPAPGVLANDTDIDGDPLAAAVSEAPTHGELALGPDGSLRYTPAANYNGPDQFRYRAIDPSGASSEATVRITVQPVPDAPIAAGDTYEVDEDATLDRAAPGVLGNDTDADGDALAAVLVSGTANGTLALRADGSFTYAPVANYHGTDRFVYRARDPGGLVSADVAVTITVRPVNDPPAATDDAYSTAEDTSLTVAAPGALVNDSDIDGDALRAEVVSGPSNGTLLLGPDGGLTYVPAPDFNGQDAFTYRALDSGGLSSVARVSLTVAAVNDAPVARADTYAVDEDAVLAIAAPGVLGNDSDVERDALTARLVAGPAKGTLVLRADGSFTYTPARDFHGEDSFRYEAFDGALASASAVVSITVRPVNDAPTATDDAYATAEDAPLTVAAPGVLGNDSDVDGDALAAVLLSGPSNGTLALAGSGGFTYTPAANFHGSDAFTYRALDPSGALSAAATVRITVTSVNDAPSAAADAEVIDEDTVLDVAAPGVLENDTDIEGDALVARLVSGPAVGTLVLRPDGSYTYTPPPNFNGTATFRYEAFDGALASAPVTVTITLAPVNDAPVASADAYSVTNTSTLTRAAPGVLGNDTDPDGNALTAVLVSGTTSGTLALASNGSFTYTPASGFAGTATFSYRASDGALSSGAATVTITVTGSSGGGGGGGGGGFGFGTPEEDFFDFEGGNVGPTTVNGVVKDALPFDWLD